MPRRFQSEQGMENEDCDAASLNLQGRITTAILRVGADAVVQEVYHLPHVSIGHRRVDVVIADGFLRHARVLKCRWNGTSMCTQRTINPTSSAGSMVSLGVGPP